MTRLRPDARNCWRPDRAAVNDAPGLSAIGAPGCLSRSLNHHRQIGVRRRPKTQGHGEKPRVVRHGLWATRVSGERRGWNFKLLCQPLNEWFDGLLQLRESNPGMAKQSKLNGKADTIGSVSTCAIGYSRVRCCSLWGVKRDAVPGMSINGRQAIGLSARRKAIAGSAAGLRQAVQRAQRRPAEPRRNTRAMSLPSWCSGGFATSSACGIWPRCS